MKPVNDGKMAEKTPQNNQKKESESNRFKINSKSKNGESMILMNYAICERCIFRIVSD